jgi:WD40 repeat protein
VPSDSLCDAQDIDCQALLSKTYIHSDSFLAADLRSRSESIQSERIYENWMGAHCPTSFVAVSSQDWVRRVDMEAYPIAVCGGARGGVYVVNMEDKNVIAMADDVHSVQVEEKANQSKVHVATEMAKQAMEKLYGKIDGGGVISVAISGDIVASSGREGGTCLWKLERYSALPPVENQEQGLDRESSASRFGILSKLAGNTGKGKNSDRTEFKHLNDAVEGKLQLLGYLPGLEKTIVTCLKFDSKQRLWAGCYDGTTRAYDVSKCTESNFRMSSQKHLFRSDFTDSVLDMSLCEEIGIGACATADGGVALFSLDDGQFFVGLMLFESPTRSVLILKRKNGGYAVCCGGSNGQIHMIPLNVDLESNKVDEDNPFLVSESTDTSIKPTAHTGPVMSLSSANEGITEGMFISAGQDGTVRVWDSNIDAASVGGTDVVGTEQQPCSAKCLYALTGYKLWLSRVITDGRVIISDGGENSIIMRNFSKERRRTNGKAI